MTFEEQKQIFSKNLTSLIDQSGKQQKDIAKELDVPYTTFNTWVRGTSMPNAARIQMLADYFNVLKTDLLDSKITEHDASLEDHANIMMAKYHLTNLIGTSASEIISSLIQLNEEGLKEIQKRINEMLCVPKYRRTLQDNDNVYYSFSEEEGMKKYDSFGREIE